MKARDSLSFSVSIEGECQCEDKHTKADFDCEDDALECSSKRERARLAP